MEPPPLPAPVMHEKWQWMEEVTEWGLAGHEVAGGWLLQPCKPTREAQARQRDVRLKTNRQTHPSDGWHQHPVAEGIIWRHPNPSPGTSLDDRTRRYLRSWSREQFKWQEGNKKKNNISSPLAGKCLPGQAGLFLSLTPRARWLQVLVMERWHPVPCRDIRQVGILEVRAALRAWLRPWAHLAACS